LTHLRARVSPWFVVGLGLAIASVTAAWSEAAAAAPENWRTDVNRTVFKKDNWTWTLRYVERTGDTLEVRLAYRNNGVNGRGLLLGSGYEDEVALVAPDSSNRFSLRAVDGISTRITRLERNDARDAVFQFTYPEGAKEVVFSSEWVMPMMGGTARFIDVEFPIPGPPDGESF